ncbi:uncharacterized protein AB675_2413 [Cyphellophora attinorum]|uniref:Uncharacterized protein n=1 Tax=Cyphellophora attinorum TaxID=1664694 RepID=A0A0N1HH56_9EURO|nr:uncharacterized protein AB675_2413 [Phialophora attinorum]KPI45190.1 hypothetical protein AB675_2413 [Phialophora attinorum]
MALEAELAQEQSAASASASYAVPVPASPATNSERNDSSDAIAPLEISQPIQAHSPTLPWDDEQLTDWADESEELEALAAQQTSAPSTEAPTPPQSDEGYESDNERYSSNNNNKDDEIEVRCEPPRPVAAWRRDCELSGRLIPFYIPEPPFPNSTVRERSPLRTMTLVGCQPSISETDVEAEAAAIRSKIAGRHLPPPRQRKSKRKSKPYDSNAFAQSRETLAEMADTGTESENVRPPKRRESKPYDPSAFVSVQDMNAEAAETQTKSEHIRPPRRRESKPYDPSAFRTTQEVEPETADTEKESEHVHPPRRRERKTYRRSIFTEHFELEPPQRALLEVQIKRAAPRAAKRKARSPAPFGIPMHHELVRPLAKTVVKKFRLHILKMQGRCSRTRGYSGEVFGNVWLDGCWKRQEQNFGYDHRSFP